MLLRSSVTSTLWAKYQTFLGKSCSFWNCRTNIFTWLFCHRRKHSDQNLFYKANTASLCFVFQFCFICCYSIVIMGIISIIKINIKREEESVFQCVPSEWHSNRDSDALQVSKSLLHSYSLQHFICSSFLPSLIAQVPSLYFNFQNNLVALPVLFPFKWLHQLYFYFLFSIHWQSCCRRLASNIGSKRGLSTLICHFGTTLMIYST